MVQLNARQIALLSVLAVVSLGIQLAPRPLPNVESTSLLTFLVGILYGGFIGGFFGGFIMFVNGFLSSWGPGGFNIPFQMAGMAITGSAGGIYKKYMLGVNSGRVRVEVTVLGTSLTLLYDIITNVGYATQLVFLARIPWSIALILAFSTGAFLSLIHISSNSVLFASAFVPLLKALQNIPGGEALWSKKELLHS